ncbi:hypothetical protein [Nocardia wallacei]|uniref:hypothetical protein n=1 Tax=Nocardia wallacei TaxID=480035 RepID=UPI002455B9FC|nr:hypothetical protein [Nocardia wallacei]
MGTVAKDGRTDKENDDRAAAGLFRFAVADGATDAGRAGTWAEILVDAFVRNWPAPVDIFAPNHLAALREQWRSEVYRPDLPFHATWKLDLRPGAAAFVGVEVDWRARTYSAVAVGDCCLLHIRGDELVTVGPIDDWKEFGSRPQLVKAAAGEETFRRAVWRNAGRYESADVLLLASDALAQCLLRRFQECDAADIETWDTGLRNGFAEWVSARRAHGELNNDDTTMCMVML